MQQNRLFIRKNDFIAGAMVALGRTKGACETPSVNFRRLTLSNALKIVFAPCRVKNSSTSRSTSTVRRGGLSTKKQETSDCPVNSQNSRKMKFLAFLEDWCAKPIMSTSL
jgi:hypothetical protein